MEKDLLILVKKLWDVKSLDELEKAKELGESFLRKEKRNAFHTLLSFSAEMGEEEVLKSVQDLSKYLEKIVKQDENE